MFNICCYLLSVYYQYFTWHQGELAVVTDISIVSGSLCFEPVLIIGGGKCVIERRKGAEGVRQTGGEGEEE